MTTINTQKAFEFKFNFESWILPVSVFAIIAFMVYCMVLSYSGQRFLSWNESFFFLVVFSLCLISNLYFFVTKLNKDKKNAQWLFTLIAIMVTGFLSAGMFLAVISH